MNTPDNDEHHPTKKTLQIALLTSIALLIIYGAIAVALVIWGYGLWHTATGLGWFWYVFALFVVLQVAYQLGLLPAAEPLVRCARRKRDAPPDSDARKG